MAITIRSIGIGFVALGAFAASTAAQQRADSTTRSYDIGGVRVIHRFVTSNDIVAANVYFLGGSRQISLANAGIERLLLSVSERGTARFTREQLRRQLARSGSTIVVDADRDWSMLGLRTTTRAFRDVWSGFADRIVAPRLDTADVRVDREETVTGLAQRRDSPDAWVEHLADSVAFAGHPYGIDPVGNERSVGALNSATLRAYHRDQMVKSRLLLVVVGNVARTSLDSLVTATLGTLPAGNYRWTLPDTIPRRASSVYRESRALPTNYLVGYAPGPRANDPDFAALRVACAILSGQLFAEIRSRQSLTYAVNAPFAERAVGAVGLYVSTNDPVAALTAMRTEIRALQEQAIDGRSLAPLVQMFITEYFMNNETNAAQADFLARAQLYDGDWRGGAGFSEAIRAVTPADIQRVMRRYFRDINFAYIGDVTRLPDSVIRGY